MDSQQGDPEFSGAQGNANMVVTLTTLRAQSYPIFRGQCSHASAICAASCSAGVATESSSRYENLGCLILVPHYA